MLSFLTNSVKAVVATAAAVPAVAVDILRLPYTGTEPGLHPFGATKKCLETASEAAGAAIDNLKPKEQK